MTLTARLIFLILSFLIFLPTDIFLKPRSEIIIKFNNYSKINSFVNELNNQNDFDISHQKIFNHDNQSKQNSLLSSSQISFIDELGKYYKIYVESESKDSVINLLLKHPDVENATENFIYKLETDIIVINDPLYKNQWYMNVIGAEKVWRFTSGKDILVGVVDTGIDFYHPELRNQLWINPMEDLNKNGRYDPWSDTLAIDGVYGDLNGIDDDGNGFIDDIIGYDFVNQYNANLGDYYNFDPVPFDENGHGTLVSGVISAQQNNNFGISGLAHNAKLVSLRAFDFSGNGQSDNIASAIVYAALNKVRIINLSFGENFYSPILHDAIKFAKSMGCLIVASSGNNGWDRRHFPSDYEEVISVGSSNVNNRRDQLSNYGDRLDILAPGTNIITTSINGDFKQVSGTSMAAPLVSASAALLLQLNPQLSPEEIKGILKSSTTDIYSKGWDRESGSGILNISNAIQFSNASELTITYPENESYFEKSKSPALPIVGTITNPLFDHYQVFISNDISSNKWDTLTPKIHNQIIKDTVCVIDLDQLNNSNYSVRIVNVLKNNRTLEKRLSFSIFELDSFNIKLLKATPLYFNDKRAVLISAETSRLSEMLLEVRDLKTEKNFTYVNHLKKDNFHQILLTNEIAFSNEIHFKAVFDFGDGIKKERRLIFNKSDDDFSTGNFKKKYNTLPLSYSFNDVIDIYGDSTKNIVVNDISGGIWQSTKIYQFEQDKFRMKDTMPSVWIPVGFGDSNGDGINEIFTKAFGSSKLFQAKVKGQNPFNNLIFADTTNGDLWGAGMFDFDGDGLKELITHTSSDIRIFKFSNGKYGLLDIIKPVEQTNRLGTSPGITFGNFDLDSNPELACALPDGRIFIFEFSNGKFRLEWSDSNPNSSSPQFLEKADIDGDGREEIISANYGNTFFFGREIPEEPVWTVRILKNISDNNYQFIWSESFFGVKSGITQSGIAFRNGLFTGNIDTDAGDEIIFAPFPNLYIFKWNNGIKSMEPFGWFSSVFTNSGIIHDFDENGINELGFSSAKGMEFFELDTSFKISPPSAIRAWATSDTTASINWNYQKEADGYEIFEVLMINNEYFVRSLTKTIQNSITLEQLKKNQWNYYVIQSYNSTNLAVSDYSGIIEIFGNNPIFPTKAEQTDSNKMLINFSGRLHQTPPNPGYFYVQNDKLEKIFPKSSNFGGDSTLIIHFDTNISDTSIRFHSHSFLDYYNNPTLDSFLIVERKISATNKELYLKNLKLLSKNELTIEFSEPIEIVGSTLLENYLLKPFGEIEEIEIYGENLVKVHLGNSTLLGPLGYYYTITVSNISSVAGNPMTKGSGNTLGFVFNVVNSQDAFVYPNPINLNIHESVVFANIADNAKIIITSINGEIIRELFELNKNGGVEWNLKDNDGKTIETGIYLFKVETANKVIVTKKFSVLK